MVFWQWLDYQAVNEVNETDLVSRMAVFKSSVIG